MQYTKGTFHTFRAVAKVHLGSIQSNLMEGEEVDFDGFTMKRGGEDHALHALRGAIKVGWLVPQDAAPTKYVPQPAGIVVHKADGISTDEINVGFDVDRDDVNVGSLQDVRPKNAPTTHKASNAGQKSDVRSGGGVNEADGKVVARFKTSAKQAAVQIGKNDRQVVQSLDNKSSVDVERVTVARAVATGDVQEAIGGESLEELLPEAASAGTPEPGVVQDGQRVESTPDLTTIQQFIPGFEWDLSVQWRRRVKIAVDQYSKIPAVLNYIQSIETLAVNREIDKRMASR
tara:strand:+ start:2201 stop:3064 length:864 start_codon:yes stop_codon:yes gene_type:complete